MLMAFLLLIVGFVLLVRGADTFVDGAVSVARRFHIPSIVIGTTLVAIGTSLPELVVCVAAAIRHEYDMAVGNIIGSNIFNILFVLGTAAVIRPLTFNMAFLTDGAIAILAVTMLMFFTAQSPRLTRFAGALFLVAYVAYVCYLIF